MSQGRPVNVSASVHQRLLNKARSSGRPFNELLQYYGMERFLYRLGTSPYADRFILKGALMLVVWRTNRTRPTMDIDFLGRMDNDPKVIRGMVIDVCGQDITKDDGIRFDTNSLTAERITEDADYEGVRLRFQGYLGSARFPMQLDLGFGDVITPAPEPIDYPSLLDAPAPQLNGYNRETAIAEKFEAMVKLAGLNSRMKDFFDIWYLSRLFDFQGEVLRAACEATFARRETAIGRNVEVLQPEFGQNEDRGGQWQAFRRRARLDFSPAAFSEVHASLASFLEPVVAALAGKRPLAVHWPAQGPWAAVDIAPPQS